MSKLNKKNFLLISGLLAGIVLLSILPLIGQAKIEDTQKNIYIGTEEVIEGNFIQVGGTVDFNGQAQKDVIVAGGTVTIGGPVKGDVIVAGGTVKITGKVDGNVRVVGGTIEINNKVEKNVSAFGGTIFISPDAEIGWDVLSYGGSIEIRGKVGGNIKGGAGSVILANEIGGNVDLKLSPEDGQLILYPQANIKGNLTYSAPKEAEIKEGAQIAGETVYQAAIPLVAPAKKILNASYFVGKIIGLLALLLIGLIIVLLARKTSNEIGKRMLDSPLVSFGWGLIYLIMTPIVLVLIAITVIGIPLALIGLVCYLITLYLTKIFIGIALGKKVMQWLNKGKEISLVWTMIVGVILFTILVSLPLIGWIIGLVGICWALGAMVAIKKQTLKQIEG